MGLLAPVGLAHLYAMPGLGRLLDKLVQADALALVLHVPQEATAIEESHEPVDVRVPVEQGPVSSLIVICVVAVPSCARAIGRPNSNGLDSGAAGSAPRSCAST